METTEHQILRHGAVAMLDILGYKGLTKHHNADKIITKLRNLQVKVPTRAKGLLSVNPSDGFEQMHPDLARVLNSTSWEPQIVFISDSIFIGSNLGAQIKAVTVKESMKMIPLVSSLSAVDLSFVLKIVAFLVAEASTGELPLVMRGCVTSGEFLFDGTVVLGPAVDEVAVLEQQAEGAFCWLAPSAFEMINNNRQCDLGGGIGFPPELAVEWEVPLKAGNLNTYVVNPFFGLSRNQIEDFNVGMNNAFARNQGRLDVEIKRQNTKRFLDRASRIACAAWDSVHGPPR